MVNINKGDAVSKKSTQTKKFSVPRELPEIQKEYQEQCISAGQLQYQMKVYSDALEKVNERLLVINNEAAARQKLNAVTETAKATPTPAEGTNTNG